MSLIDDIRNLASTQYREIAKSLEDSRSIGDYVLLYGAKDIEERNKTYEVQAYMPGWIAIGDDSGGQAILMKLDGSHGVYLCDHGALGSLDPEVVADSFSKWLEGSCPIPGHDDEEDEF